MITGFRNRELRSYVYRRFGLSPDDYTAAQLRYDLLKLQAKGWIRKLDGTTRYVLTPKGMVQGTAIIKLKGGPDRWSNRKGKEVRVRCERQSLVKRNDDNTQYEWRDRVTWVHEGRAYEVNVGLVRQHGGVGK